MPRGVKGSGTTTRRRRTSAATTQSAPSTSAGQLVWSGVAPGSTAFELYEVPTGGMQFFQVTNINGTITRTLMWSQGAAQRINNSRRTAANGFSNETILIGTPVRRQRNGASSRSTVAVE
jgi:hypothetical protein